MKIPRVAEQGLKNWRKKLEYLQKAIMVECPACRNLDHDKDGHDYGQGKCPKCPLSNTKACDMVFEVGDELMETYDNVRDLIDEIEEAHKKFEAREQ